MARVFTGLNLPLNLVPLLLYHQADKMVTVVFRIHCLQVSTFPFHVPQ